MWFSDRRSQKPGIPPYSLWLPGSADFLLGLVIKGWKLWVEAELLNVLATWGIMQVLLGNLFCPGKVT